MHNAELYTVYSFVWVIFSSEAFMNLDPRDWKFWGYGALIWGICLLSWFVASGRFELYLGLR